MRWFTVMTLAAASVHAQEVTIGMSGDAVVPNAISYPARCLITRILGAINVRARWTTSIADGGSTAKALAIRARFTTGTPESFHPGALAYAQPFDRVPVITILYDRLQVAVARRPSLSPALLAHVLAHEIGHILLGTDAHAQVGIMKAHWSSADYDAMFRNPLPFTALDQKLIRMRLGTDDEPAAELRQGGRTVTRLEWTR